jgi:hypothetical protein
MKRQDTAARGVDAETIMARLHEAGATLQALPTTGPSLRMKTQQFGALQDIVPLTDRNNNKRMRPPVPSAEQITRMDDALSWLALIPDDRYVLRRIVALRSITNPMTGAHLYSWQRIADKVHADSRAIKQWHKIGIDLIVDALRPG